MQNFLYNGKPLKAERGITRNKDIDSMFVSLKSEPKRIDGFRGIEYMKGNTALAPHIVHETANRINVRT